MPQYDEKGLGEFRSLNLSPLYILDALVRNPHLVGTIPIGVGKSTAANRLLVYP